MKSVLYRRGKRGPVPVSDAEVQTGDGICTVQLSDAATTPTCRSIGGSVWLSQDPIYHGLTSRCVPICSELYKVLQRKPSTHHNSKINYQSKLPLCTNLPVYIQCQLDHLLQLFYELKEVDIEWPFWRHVNCLAISLNKISSQLPSNPKNHILRRERYKYRTAGVSTYILGSLIVEICNILEELVNSVSDNIEVSPLLKDSIETGFQMACYIRLFTGRGCREPLNFLDNYKYSMNQTCFESICKKEGNNFVESNFSSVLSKCKERIAELDERIIKAKKHEKLVVSEIVNNFSACRLRALKHTYKLHESVKTETNGGDQEVTSCQPYPPTKHNFLKTKLPSPLESLIESVRVNQSSDNTSVKCNNYDQSGINKRQRLSPSLTDSSTNKCNTAVATYKLTKTGQINIAAARSKFTDINRLLINKTGSSRDSIILEAHPLKSMLENKRPDRHSRVADNSRIYKQLKPNILSKRTPTSTLPTGTPPTSTLPTGTLPTGTPPTSTLPTGTPPTSNVDWQRRKTGRNVVCKVLQCSTCNTTCNSKLPKQTLRSQRYKMYCYSTAHSHSNVPSFHNNSVPVVDSSSKCGDHFVSTSTASLPVSISPVSSVLPVSTSPVSPVLPVSTSPVSSVLPVSTSPVSPVLPVSTSPVSPVLPVSTSPVSPVLPVSTSPVSSVLPVSTSPVSSVLPVSASPVSSVLPVSTSPVSSVLPVSTSPVSPVLPVSASPVSSVLPVSTSPVSPVLPVSASPVSSVLPVSTSPVSPVLPVSASPVSSVLPVSTSPVSPVLPVSTSPVSPVLPVSTSPVSPVLPVSASPVSSVLPVSASPVSSVLPVSTSPVSSVLPVSTSPVSPVLPVSTSPVSSVLPVSTSPVSPVLPVSTSPVSPVLPVSTSPVSSVLPVSTSVCNTYLPPTSQFLLLNVLANNLIIQNLVYSEASNSQFLSMVSTSVTKPSVPRWSETNVPQRLVASLPQPLIANVPQPLVANVPQSNVPQPLIANVPQPLVANIPQSNVPRPLVANVPQPLVANVPQPLVVNVPQPLIANVPQPLVANIPRSNTQSTTQSSFVNILANNILRGLIYTEASKEQCKEQLPLTKTVSSSEVVCNTVFTYSTAASGTPNTSSYTTNKLLSHRRLPLSFTTATSPSNTTNSCRYSTNTPFTKPRACIPSTTSSLPPPTNSLASKSNPVSSHVNHIVCTTSSKTLPKSKSLSSSTTNTTTSLLPVSKPSTKLPTVIEQDPRVTSHASSYYIPRGINNEIISSIKFPLLKLVLQIEAKVSNWSLKWTLPTDVLCMEKEIKSYEIRYARLHHRLHFTTEGCKNVKWCSLGNMPALNLPMSASVCNITTNGCYVIVLIGSMKNNSLIYSDIKLVDYKKNSS